MRHCEATPGHTAILIPSYIGRDGAVATISARALASVSKYPPSLFSPTPVSRRIWKQYPNLA